MNTCMTISCTTCEQDTDCRIGYSNRLIQPIQFACPHCHSMIGITLDISEAPRSKFTFKGCEQSVNQPAERFDGTNPFVDLHLDFPVKFDKYKPGLTPWFAALNQLEGKNRRNRDMVLQQSMFHSSRLDVLNQMYSKVDELTRLINLYHGNNKQLFQKRAAKFLEMEQKHSILQQDLNATLYLVIAKVFFPFMVHEHSREISKGLPKLFQCLNQEQFGLFIEDLFESGFLIDIQRDCLRIYPRVLNAEIPFRPALFLDFIENEEPELVAGRVSSQDFFALKDIYKDILEIISRQIVIVAGLNNLYHRGDFNSFKAIDGGKLSSLQILSKKNLSDRFKYLDDCWYNLSIADLNLGLRNAIAHNNIDYCGKTQIVTYYPEGGQLNPSEGKTLSFLSFMRSLLLAFREMHNLHHVIKSLYYYKLLIHDRRTEASHT